jgi:predicted O-methyltransferase YrrM
MGPECYRAYVKESNKLLKRGPVNYFDDVIRQTNPPSPTPPAEQKESAIGRWQREYGPMAMYQKEKEKEEEKCDQ